jgi:hypothetical protein
MLKCQGFEILMASPPDYARLVAEVYFDGKFVALISQERGPELYDVETPTPDMDGSQIARRVDAQGLIAAITVACERLSDG